MRQEIMRQTRNYASESAGINRHIVGDEKALRKRRSDFIPAPSNVGIQRKRVNWILDADIRGFFDNMSHEWTMKFMEHRVADPRILRLIRKWLKAGVSEDGKWSETKAGTPQGQ